jgi:hypothetical protein
MGKTMKVIGFVGFKGSGKDTTAIPYIEQGYQKTSFAGVLKDVCAAIFGWDRQMLEGTDAESRLWREETDLWWAEKLKRPGFSPRRAFQQMGTDVIRQNFDDSIWIHAVERQMSQTGGDWVITDCRFPNELKLIKDMGGTIIRVKRGPEPEWYDYAKVTNDKDNQSYDSYQAAAGFMATKYKDIHISEWAWIGSPYIDHEVDNDSTLDELHAKVRRIVG